MEKGWKGLPYKTIAQHYDQIFGTKVYKIPVAVVDDCPNRMGLKGMETCAFCDVWGSAARSEAFSLELPVQIQKYKTHIQKKFKAKKFLVYFQAYTNTFTKVSELEKNFNLALETEDVVGFVIGTRPDCLSPAVLKLWEKFNQQAKVFVELGVQSFFNDDLIFMKRGHSSEASLEAIKKINDNTSVDLGIHLIFGNPNENIERIKKTAHIVNSLPITNVKLHNLHILKNTHLEKIFLKNEFSPIDLPLYCDYVGAFLSELSPKFALHRLSAFASRWDELIAPAWTADKIGTHQKIID
ncbi:MAG: TIGR01212 family radical SAM protein, partial [Bdellovibrionaceae bacterium]|nr:TIGR01212 family radical SAM protein [Pseudobdellovibrionaceae bacterium]